MVDSRVKQTVACGVFIGLIASSGCNSVLSESPPDEVRIGADSASAPLTEGLVNAFEGLHPDTPFTLIQNSRETVLQSVRDGEVDAAIVLGSPADRALFANPIALELVVIITHPSNPVESVSLETLRSMLTGQISDWESAGGESMPIALMTTPAGSSTRLFLEGLLLQADSISSSARVIADERTLVQWVANTPGSLGFVPFSNVTTNVRSLAVDDSAPTPSLARQESYPLLAQIVFISREEPEDFMRALLDWIVSADGQHVVRRYMLGYND